MKRLDVNFENRRAKRGNSSLKAERQASGTYCTARTSVHYLRGKYRSSSPPSLRKKD